MVPVNYVAIFAAAILSMIIGSLWFGPLFGKQWMQLMGMKKSDMKGMKSSDMARLYGIQFVGSLLMAFVLSHALVFASTYLHESGVSAGLQTGFWNWIGFIAPVTVGSVLWEGKSWKLWLFNNSYYLVSLCAMGVLLAVWTTPMTTNKVMNVIPSPIPYLSTNWKTYTNTAFGFSVQYDPIVNPLEVKGNVQQLLLVGFGSIKNNGFDIEVSTGDSMNYYKHQITEQGGRISKEESITVDGITATKLTYKQVLVTEEVDFSKVIIRNNNHDYIITALSPDIDRILSTFTFVQVSAI